MVSIKIHQSTGEFARVLEAKMALELTRRAMGTPNVGSKALNLRHVRRLKGLITSLRLLLTSFSHTSTARWCAQIPSTIARVILTFSTYYSSGGTSQNLCARAVSGALPKSISFLWYRMCRLRASSYCRKNTKYQMFKCSAVNNVHLRKIAIRINNALSKEGTLHLSAYYL